MRNIYCIKASCLKFTFFKNLSPPFLANNLQIINVYQDYS